MVDKELIKKLVSIFPSKDLKKVYEEDFNNGIYPSWDEDDIMSLINQMFFSRVKLENIVNFLKFFIEKVESADKKDKIQKITNELMHKGRKRKWGTINYDEFSKYVIVKNIFKSGDLIKFKSHDKTMYGIVGNFDYEKFDKMYLEGKKYFDFSDMVYYSHTLYDDVNITNPYDIYACHDHPSKLEVEKACEEELNFKLKEYANFIREKILYADSKKIFEEYDKIHKIMS